MYANSMMVNVSLPSQFGACSLGKLANKIAPNGILPQGVNFDFSSLAFIRPEGVAYLGNLCEWLVTQNVSVTFSNHLTGNRSIQYLDDCGFFERYLGQSISPNANRRGTTFPLSSVRHTHAHQAIEQGIVPWLSGRMNHSERELSGLKGVLSELFNNVRDHTAFDIGCLFAQDFPRENRVLVAFSDFGCGIPKNVRSKLESLDDYLCICKAAEDGFTTGTTRNMGTGLFITLQQVVGLNGGTVTIRSSLGSALFHPRSSFSPQSSAMCSQFAITNISSSGWCIGTMIELSLPTDRQHWFGGDEGEEGFEW